MTCKTSNIIVVGPPAAGKSTLGRRLAERMGLDFYDVDRLIEENLGVSIDTVFAMEGETGFRKRETKMLKSTIENVSDSVIATGGGCVLREENRRLLRTQRLVIYLDVSPDVQFARVSRDSRRPLLQCGDLQQTLQTQRNIRTPLYESVADLRFISDALKVRDVEFAVRRALEATKQ